MYILILYYYNNLLAHIRAYVYTCKDRNIIWIFQINLINFLTIYRNK